MTDSPSGRLRITHWLLLSVCCAGVATVQQLGTEWSSIPADQRWQARLTDFFRTLGFGVALAGTFVVASRWRDQSGERRSSPGAWLLLWVATLALVMGATELVGSLLSGTTHPFFVWHYKQCVLHGSAAVVCGVFAAPLPGRWDWKLLLIVPVVPLACAATLNYWAARSGWIVDAYLVPLMIATYATEVLLMGRACLRDRREQLQRDWLHWLGVALFVAIAAHDLTFATLAGMRMLR